MASSHYFSVVILVASLYWLWKVQFSILMIANLTNKTFLKPCYTSFSQFRIHWQFVNLIFLTISDLILRSSIAYCVVKCALSSPDIWKALHFAGNPVQLGMMYALALDVFIRCCFHQRHPPVFFWAYSNDFSS